MKRSFDNAAVCFVYITAPDRKAARDIAETLVKEELAACVNILPEITSFYRWDDKMQESCEVAMIAKTLESAFTRLAKKIREIHPYDCPCIVAMPITKGYAPFLEWIADSVIA